MVCQFLLYNKVNQLYIHIHLHISCLLHLPPTLPIPPLQVDTKHRADLPVLCGCFPLAIYVTFGSVYISMPLSHFVPACPFPLPVSSSPFSACASLFLSCPQVLQNLFFFFFFFRFHVYMLAHGICFSLSDLFYSAQNPLGPSMLPQMARFHSFTCLSNIPLYTYTTSSLSIHLLMDAQVALISVNIGYCK